MHGHSDDMPVCSLRWRPSNSGMKTANVLVSCQADGWLKHWHATSGKCLHQMKCEDNPDNDLYTLDYNNDGTLLATAGKDKYVRLYDEQTKSLVLKMKDSGELCGHSNRIFCVKFDPFNPDRIASGGWDNTIQIYDIRRKGPVASIYGPHICGEAIDFHSDGNTLLTGSYRQDNVLELWDLRNHKKIRNIEWNGPLSEPADSGLEGDANESEEEKKENEPAEKVMQVNRENPAPFIYSAVFNHETGVVMAAGAGANQVRLFDYETGNIVCVISDLPKAILCMTKANQSNDFAFGSVDSKIRIMTQRVLKEPFGDSSV